eukprot:3287902-Amphidinium_carterae.2
MKHYASLFLSVSDKLAYKMKERFSRFGRGRVSCASAIGTQLMWSVKLLWWLPGRGVPSFCWEQSASGCGGSAPSWLLVIGLECKRHSGCQAGFVAGLLVWGQHADGYSTNDNNYIT